MTEPMSDALFGVDGTELPRLSRDPTGRSSWGDVSVPPPVPLPAIPELNMTREAIAAALGEDPGGSRDQGQATAAPAAPPAAGQAAAPAPLPPAASAASAANRQQAPTVTAVATPGQAPQRGPGAPGYLRSTPTRSLPRVKLRASRRRAGRIPRALPTQTRSNGGAGAFFLISVIVVVVLLYFIVSGIVESFARLIP